MARNSEAGSAGEVREMYEAYPYPSPTVGNTLIEDVANSLYTIFSDDSLSDRRILDAGCGTGHRLLAVARRYPQATFVGLDMTSASIEVAKDLRERHRIRNVDFHNCDLLEFRPAAPFDIILSIGVVHHLKHPGRGLESLASHMSKAGILVLWLYHPLGEHQRLLDRDTLLTLWDREEGFDAGLGLLRDMGLKLEIKRYGRSAAQSKAEVSHCSIDVDAYLHPIVHAYRFDEIISMLSHHAHLDWAAVNNVNLIESSKLVDLNEVETGDMRYFCAIAEDLFSVESLRQRYRKLESLKKLRVLENRLQPTGFTILGGRGESHRDLSHRVRSNLISL